MKASHRNTLESIPWLVNGRMTDDERRALEKHVNECAECREEFELQQRLQAAMTRESPRVDYAPGASLQKLWTRIDSTEQLATPPRPVKADVTTARGSRLRFTQWLAAAVIIEAIGITFLAVRTPNQTVASAPPAAIRTVTTTEIVPQTAVLRVVFAPHFSVSDMNALLRTQQLSIVGGPNTAGAFTLATTAAIRDLPVALPNTVANLQAHRGVLLVQPIGYGLETKP